MASLTEPLEFRKQMRSAPRAGLDGIPFLDVLLIAVFTALNLSSFVIAPGTVIELPTSESGDFAPSPDTAVLTVDRNGLFFFEGAKLSESSLVKHFSSYIEGRSSHVPAPPELLIKADSTISAKALFALMDKAREAGFVRVHLAAEFPAQEGTNLPPGRSPVP